MTKIKGYQYMLKTLEFTFQSLHDHGFRFLSSTKEKAWPLFSLHLEVALKSPALGLYSNQLISIFVAAQTGAQANNKRKHALSNNVPIQEMMCLPLALYPGSWLGYEANVL